MYIDVTYFDLTKFLHFIAGAALLFMAFRIWKNSERVLKAVPWPMAWATYMILILTGFEQLAISGIFDQL